MSETIVGIDASLTNTAVCIYRRDGSHEMKTFQSDPAATLAGRMYRYKMLAQMVTLGVGVHPSVVFIEGYSFASPNRAVPLAEYGGILRHMLIEGGAQLKEITPSTVKQFATQKGNSDKTAMTLACFKLWGQEFKTNDEVDAYCIARLGACALGWDEATNEAQRRAVSVVLGVKVEKPKKRKAG